MKKPCLKCDDMMMQNLVYGYQQLNNLSSLRPLFEAKHKLKLMKTLTLSGVNIFVLMHAARGKSISRKTTFKTPHFSLG